MATIPNGTLYEATPVDILCNVAILGVASNTTGYTITRQWLKGSAPITAGPEYTITNDTLHTKKLSRTRDNKNNITCVAMLILPSGAHYVQQESIILTVEGEILWYKLHCTCTVHCTLYLHCYMQFV